MPIMGATTTSFMLTSLLFTSGVLAAGKANTFELVGETGVSAQQLFLGAANKVYIVDKVRRPFVPSSCPSSTESRLLANFFSLSTQVENNPATIAGHPAWATEYDIDTNTYRAMDIITNSFCAGGTLLGNGSWLNAGGNNAVTTGGVSDSAVDIVESTKTGAYEDLSGGRAQRIITPCTNETCTCINPMDKKPAYVDEDDLPHRRGMGNFIILPDQRLFLVNGVGHGSAGYGTQNWTRKYGVSYAKDPVLTPSYYNHSAPVGQRHDSNLPNSTINRMYHSSATLLPDGSVFIAGSNPNPDVITEANNASYPYKTEYRAERFYPSYYDAGRPVPSGVPSTITYGGKGFNITLPASSINGTENLASAFVGIYRGGFSTHAINFGMRYVELKNSYTGNSDGSATLHVSQLPPNPAILVPGPAMLFVVINNIPSVGIYVMVGSGTIETQPLLAATVLPASTLNGKATSTNGTTNSTGTSTKSGSKASGAAATSFSVGLAVAVALSSFTFLF
ncbi:hypothetical protein P7C70_g7874, partial [Phenoliferia sp. Uapishka_3]